MIGQMRLPGTSLAYVDEGAGEPVVCLHPASSDHRAWEAQREIFARRCRFIALDLRYFGTAPWPDEGGNFSVATFAADLADCIRALDAGPVHLVGWSYSGGTILTLATRQPELVKSLFVFEPAIATFVADPAAARLAADDRQAIFGPAAKASAAGDQAAAVEAFMDGANGQPGSFAALPAAVRAMMLDNARMLPLLFAAPPPPPISCEQLGQLRMPAAIARGELTRPFYRICADAASRCIPGCRTIVVPGARHLWPAQDPAAFNATLLDWLGL